MTASQIPWNHVNLCAYAHVCVFTEARTQLSTISFSVVCTLNFIIIFFFYWSYFSFMKNLFWIYLVLHLFFFSFFLSFFSFQVQFNLSTEHFKLGSSNDISLHLNCSYKFVSLIVLALSHHGLETLSVCVCVSTHCWIFSSYGLGYVFLFSFMKKYEFRNEK